tara:strand:- start:89 stop:679 length:591 start_codon:yes stop_codon:yes gene_type:complete
MINFAIAVFFLIITPGPGVLSVAGVGAAFGFKSGVRYITGLFFGTNLVALAVVSGLATIVLSNNLLRLFLMLCSSSYLLFLAYRIALSGAMISFSKAERKPGIIDGIFLQLVNPKAYAVNTAMYTGFLIYPNSIALEIAVKFIIMNLIWFPIHFFWLFVGVYLKGLNLSAKLQFKINLLMAFALVVVVILALISSF